MKSLALDWFLDSVFPERLGCHYAKISTPSFADTPRYEGGGSLGILIWLWFSLYWVEGACPNNHEFCFGLCLSMCVLPSFSYLSRVLPWTKLCRTALIAFLPWQSLCFMRWKDGGSCYCVFGLAESQHLLKFVEAQESMKQIIPRIHRCRTLPWCMRQRYKLQRGARAFEPHRQRCCIERHLRSSSDLWPCALATSIWSLRLHWYDFIPRHLFWEDVALRNIGLISTRLHHLSGNVGTMWRPNASKYVNGALEAARSGASTNQRYVWCSFYSNSSIWERISGTITIMIRIIMYDAYSIYIYMLIHVNTILWYDYL